MSTTLGKIAKVLGGEVRGAQVLAPGPRHSRNDRSLSIKLIASDESVVHSFAGDDPIDCRDYVRAKLGLGPLRLHKELRQNSLAHRQVQPCNDDETRQHRSLP